MGQPRALSGAEDWLRKERRRTQQCEWNQRCRGRRRANATDDDRATEAKRKREARRRLHSTPAEQFPGATAMFRREFVDYPFGVTCAVCDRLWVAGDVLHRAARVPHLFVIAGSFLTLSGIPESMAQERPLHGDQSDAANRIPWPVYTHSGPSQFQAFPQPQPRFPQSILPPSFIKVINAVGSPDWETTTTTSSGAASSTTLTTTPSTTTTSTTTTTQPPPVTSVALSSVEVRAPEVDPLSPSAWKAVQDQPQVPKRRRFQQIKRRRKPRPKEEDIKHFGENRNLGTQPPGTTAYPRTSRTTRRQPSTALIRGYRSKAPQVAPPTTTKRPFPRFPNGLKKFSPTPRWPTLTTSTTTTTTSTTSTRKPFIFGERRVPSWYGQTTPTTPRPPPTTIVPKLHRFGPNSNLRYKNDDLIKGPLARLRPPLRRSAIVRDAVPQTIEKDELELSQSIQTPNGRRRVTYTAPPRRYQAKNQHGQEQFPPHLMVNRTERGGQQGRSEPSDEVGEVVRFVAIPHFVGGTIPSRRADFREGGRAPLRRMYRPPFSMPGRRRFPFPGPVAVYPQSLASLEDSSQDEEAPIRIPVPRPAGPYPLLPPPPGLPIRVLRQPYSSNAGGPPTNVVQEQQQQQQQHPVRTNSVPPAFPRPLGSLGNANLHGRMNSKPEEPRCDRFSEDICLDDFEYPS
ncbi:hypothetical protein HPB47_023920 [Ixodes persulcatus]|uniref:Uncharacterized protein n=1 Tax=Ixodes persulcatus TaxID=34615 RepID=A0AC60Q7N1_IXOPE|nr:hypothetical protein HPB47_023920 [Ixodes persulcatus]